MISQDQVKYGAPYVDSQDQLGKRQMLFGQMTNGSFQVARLCYESSELIPKMLLYYQPAAENMYVIQLYKAKKPADDFVSWFSFDQTYTFIMAKLSVPLPVGLLVHHTDGSPGSADAHGGH
jgi:hypothetical protein